MIRLSTAALLASACFAFAAHAGDTLRTQTQIEVFYGDLNLGHPAGAATMINRIDAAAARVCGGSPDSRDMHERRAFRACVTEATSDAVRQLNAPLVTALFYGRPAGDPRIAAR